MATIIERNGRWTVQVFIRGKRETVAMGIGSKREAQRYADRIIRLAASASRGDAPEPDLSEWLTKIDDALHARLAAIGLVKDRGAATLGSFTESYIASRKSAKPRTIAILNRARTALVDYFGADRTLTSITQDDARKFREAKREKWAEATTRRVCGFARQFFRAAMRAELVYRNPFDGMPVAVNGNEESVYVPAETVEKIIAACPSMEWKLIVALSRYAGLRTPSETVLLTWRDIDLHEGRMTIRSPKTEHHAGKESRVCPIVPRLAELLQEAYDALPEGAGLHVVTGRHSSSNLGTHLRRIMARAGVKPWRRTFHAMRASCQTDLCKRFPVHAVCEWLGNSALIAQKHYLSVTDDLLAAAAGKSAAPALQQALHSAQQQGILGNGEQVGTKNEKRQNRREITDDSASSPLSTIVHENGAMHPAGLEPATF